jgi:peptide/nickel transport system ATP-binding protein
VTADPPLLQIRGLRTVFRMPGGGEFAAVDGVDLEVPRGRTLGVVGESGCGKSVLSLSIMRLVPPPGRVAAGEVRLEGRDLLALPPAEMRQVRGGQVAMIFQEPMTSLNPVHSVGAQIVEAMRAHDPRAPAAELRERAIRALARVRIPAPERRFEEHPHQLSGGMRQRVMIAMALACGPRLLIAQSRPPRSTSPCRRRSWTCCGSCRRRRGCRSSSSPTTSAWWRRWPTRWR